MYEIMYYAGMILAVVFLIASVILFIRNKVWKLIGDVTGLNARRAIKRLRQKGAEDTSKTEAIKPETSKVLVHKATTTGTLQAMTELEESERLKRTAKTKKRKQRNSRLRKEQGTALLQQENVDTSSIFEVEEEVTVLAGAANPNRIPEAEAMDTYTTVLSSEESGIDAEVPEEEEITTKLYREDEPTTLLSHEGDEQTTLLTREGDEDTTLLVREGDDVTTLLAKERDEDSKIEAEFAQFEPVLQEDDELMALLQTAAKKE
ncbi:MAG TPA: hypothetical protein DHV96_09570 [Lachnospiraceae bacterium]|nr:hypothetical protein [Lachnospiraceae bacterium]